MMRRLKKYTDFNSIRFKNSQKKKKKKGMNFRFSL